MTLELNYDSKTITVKGTVNLREFVKEIKRLGINKNEWNVVSDITRFEPYYPYLPNQPYFTEKDFINVPYVSTEPLANSYDVQYTITTNC